MCQTRFLNLVFQGGGARGIAYAGALDAMPGYCRINAVAGTSAGAIVAGLLAIGKSGTELKEILRDPALFNLIQREDMERTARLMAAWTDLCALGNRAAAPSLRSLWRLKHRHKTLFSDLAEVWRARGFHSSDDLRKWLGRIFEDKKFEDIKLSDLKIVAADLNGQQYVIYGKERHQATLIADAVHASISIPIFFRPYTSGITNLVDGGLLSNFPSFLFAQAEYPTIGFRLGDIAKPKAIQGTLDYLLALLFTMTEAHDKQRGTPRHFKEYRIDTPPNLPSTKFDLSEADVHTLYQAGLATGRAVDWDSYSSITPVVAFYDPQPDEILEFSLTQARRLWERYTDKSLWVERLDSETTFTARIERDWSVSYDRLGKMKVCGPKPLIIARMQQSGIPAHRASGPVSFLELPHVCQERVRGEWKDLIRIPAFNVGGTKGFVVAFVPPISSDDPEPREFHMAFTVPCEFEQTLGRGVEDHVSYSVNQIADVHSLRLRIRIMMDTDLPDIGCSTEFGVCPVLSGTEYDETARRSYRIFECDLEERQIIGTARFSVTLRKVPQQRWP